MRATYAVETSYQYLVACLEKDDARMAALAFELGDRFAQVGGEGTAADVDDAGDAGDRSLGAPTEVDHRGDQARRQVVDDEPAQVLETFRRRTPTRTGQATDDGNLERRTRLGGPHG